VRYFVALADFLNFGRAAAHLGIAQPSLSHQIRQLESELQASLFLRTTRRVRLTEAGRLFLGEAREILARADHATVIARRASLGEVGTLRVGCAYWMDAARILASMKSFHDRNPAIQFEVQTIGSPQQVVALRDERLDVGFVRPPLGEPSVASEILMSEPFVVALSVKHRLASRERIAVSDLADEALILPPRVQVPVVHDLVLKLCREARFVPKVPHEIDHPQMVLGLVATGVGIAFVPVWVRKARPRGVVLRPLRPSARILQTALAWRRDAAWPLVRGFVEAVRPLWPGE
jgi:DNA-binding transcriptional LysR family regulator